MLASNLSFCLFLVWSICVCYSFPQFINNIESTFCNQTIKCAGNGDSCLSLLQCNASNGSWCAVGLYCNNGTCASDNVGASCKTALDCHFSLSDGNIVKGCFNNVCGYQYFPGDTCSNNSNCAYGLNCNTTCQGLGIGSVCTSANQCAFGLYCGGTCQNTTGANSTCILSATCAPGYACIGGKCQTAFTQTAGGKCIDDITCSSGLSCASNGTCVTPQTSYTTCSNTTDCLANSICTCNPDTGNGICMGPSYVVDPCSDENSNLYNCIVESKCSSATDAPESCCYANCYSQYKKSFSCSCSQSDSLTGDCTYLQYCEGFPVWAIILIIVVALVLVLAVILLVFFMMRRRRQYDTI